MHRFAMLSKGFMRGSRKFCQRGSNIFFIKGKRIQIALNGVSLAGRRWPYTVIFQGIWTNIAKGGGGGGGGGPDPLDPLDPHMRLYKKKLL